MKEILLTQGKVTSVDNSVFDFFNQWKWCAAKHHNTYYATRIEIIEGKRTTFYLHREIVKAKKGIQVDHWDGDGLNNQGFNLRNATNGQNQSNRKPWGKSKYLGVSYQGKYILAQIRTNKEIIHLGNFKTEEDAARAYDKAAIRYHGDFAKLNLPQE